MFLAHDGVAFKQRLYCFFQHTYGTTQRPRQDLCDRCRGPVVHCGCKNNPFCPHFSIPIISSTSLPLLFLTLQLFHYIFEQISTDVAGMGKAGAVVACCYDDASKVPPIKAATQRKRREAVAVSNVKFVANSLSPIPSGPKYQPFIRYSNNRDLIASELFRFIATEPNKGVGGSATIFSIGVTPDEEGDGGSASPAGAEGSGGVVEPVLPVQVVRDGRPCPPLPGPGIGEGELSTTHAIIHHAAYTRGEKRSAWLVTSVDTDQIVHLLLAMASDKINPTGTDKVQVTVRRRKGQGAVEFVDVNRLYTALVEKPAWETGAGERGVPPRWLKEDDGQAKVALFVVMYFLSGCDFMPGFFSLPLKKMFTFVEETISQPGLFMDPIVYKDGEGKWAVDIEECIKMLGVCYFQMHRTVFQVKYPSGAAQMLEDLGGDAKEFIKRVRLIIFKAMGSNGKRNCPAWMALEKQVERALAVLKYWQSAFDARAEPVEFEGHGWVAADGAGGKLTSANCCVQLSDYAVSSPEGRVKILTCTCGSRKTKAPPTCDGKKCKCAIAKRACVPMQCGCKGACVQNRTDKKKKDEKRVEEATREYNGERWWEPTLLPNANT